MKRLFATMLLAGLAPQWATAQVAAYADAPTTRRAEPWAYAPQAGAQPAAVAPAAYGAPCDGGACRTAYGKSAWGCFKDWFCFRQTPNCLGLTPTPYYPPLYVWFPCDPAACGGPMAGCPNGRCHAGGAAPASPVYYPQAGAPVAGPAVAPTPMPAREPVPTPMPAPNTGVRANPPGAGFRMAAPESPALTRRPAGYRPPLWSAPALQ